MKAIDNFENKKKKEEKHKFIFKHVMKSLKEKTKKESFTRKKVLKKLLNEKFSKKYFDNLQFINKSLFEELNCYSKSRGNINFAQNHLNKSFFQNLFQVQNLKKDFFEYLHQNFLKDYSVKVENKIKSFLETKVKKVLAKNDCGNGSMKTLCEKIENDPKWKIPWTLNEAENALREFCIDFEKN